VNFKNFKKKRKFFQKVFALIVCFRTIHPPRRGGRVVECTSLENWSTGNRTGGSNPLLSAIFEKEDLNLAGSMSSGAKTMK
jgi:hypothetical protein